jgi:hypothetical protein
MYKNATKCNETIDKWCKNKHGASKIIDTFETYQPPILVGHQQHPERVRNLHFRLGMKGCITVKGVGTGGGLALFFTEDVEVDLLSYSPRHIDIHVHGGPFGVRW